MSAPARGSRDGARLLTFEVAGHIYALPIDGILEVAEVGDLCGIPTLARGCSAVMNWHGEALPLVAPHLLVESNPPARADGSPSPSAEAGPEIGAAGDSLATEHVLVISDRGDQVARLGLPIDGVLGIVDGPVRAARASSGEVVVERRPVDGRIVSVLDVRRLVGRAFEVIERMAA